jgi:hypothetical protein
LWKLRRNAKATAVEGSATGQLVSPSEPTSKDVDIEDYDINKNLFQIMNGSGEEGADAGNCSPAKSKQKQTASTASKKSAPVTKHKVKSALKTGFCDSHIHNFPANFG